MIVRVTGERTLADPMHEPEVLYRQVGTGGSPIFFDPDRSPPLFPAVFLPSRADVDGLSLIHSRFRSTVWSAFRVEQPEVRFRIVVLTREFLQEAATIAGIKDFDLRSTPDALDKRFGPPNAHCVASAINRRDYDQDREARKRIKSWTQRISNSLSAADVVGPFPIPESEDSYRP